MNVQADILGPDDARWLDFLAGTRHDVHHLPEFVAFATRTREPGRPAAVMVTEGDRAVLVPLIIRPIPPELADGASWQDATGPRGYPGPIFRRPTIRPTDERFLERAAVAMKTTLREQGIVSAFVRCHPLLSPPLETLRRSGEVVNHGESVSMDLSVSASDSWTAIRENHRRSILGARRDGYTARVDTSWGRLDEFLAIHDAVMQRRGASEEWYISRAYVEDMRATLGPRVHLCVVEKDDDLAAAAILTEVAGIVEYHLAGTAAGHVGASPSKLLIEFASCWARDAGNRTFHLAGSTGRDDALIHFKRGFSPLRHPVASWRLVCDPEAYRVLVGRREHSHGASGSMEPNTADFFPRYRSLPSVQVEDAHMTGASTLDR